MARHLGIKLGSTRSALAYLHPRSQEALLLPAFEGLEATFSSRYQNHAFRKYEITQSQEVATALLQHLKSEAETFLQFPLACAHLAVPDNYQSDQREALHQAGLQAGFERLQLIDNSRCILLAHRRLQQTGDWLLFLLGGSSLEVSLCRVKEGQLTRLAYAEENLGGRDWDFVLDHHLNQNQNRLASASLEAFRRQFQRRQQVNWDNIRLTRDDFLNLSAPLLQRCRRVLEQVLQGRSINGAFLSGGASRIPGIAELVETCCGLPPEIQPRPEEDLAIGALLAESLAPLPPAPARRAPASTVIMKTAEISHLLQQLKSQSKEAPEVASPPLEPTGPTANPEPTVAETPIRSPRLMAWSERATVLKTVLKSAWQQEPVPGSRPCWRLLEDFTEHYFPGAGYFQVACDGEFATGDWGCLVFYGRDGSFDIVLRSRQVAEDHYEFRWRPGDPPAQTERRSANRGVGQARISSAPGAPLLILHSPDIEEQIQFDPIAVVRVDAESQRDRQRRMAPWLRLLLWFGRLQQIDPPTFRNLPRPIRDFLSRPGAEAALSNLPPGTLEPWVQQGLLPPQLEPIHPDQLEPLKQSILQQQSLAHQQPAPGSGFLASLGLAPPPQAPPIPRILIPINVQLLDLLDLQVFLTLGALASPESLFDREFRSLLARRPDLQARLRSPEGQGAVLSDPEVAALRNRPDVVRENAEKAWKSTGMGGPSPMEQNEATQRAIMMQLWTGYSFDPGPTRPSGPPWRLYQPYQG